MFRAADIFGNDMAKMLNKKNLLSAMTGAVIGYFFVHPLMMLISHFMSSASQAPTDFVYNSVYLDILRSFSLPMLPWSLSFAIFGALLGFLYGAIKQADKEKSRLIIELQDALAEVKTLSGLLPICSWCKKIRDDKGYWNRIESYIKEHSEAEFTHGICQECAEKQFPELFKNDSKSVGTV